VLDPQRTRSYFWGVVTSLPLLAIIDQKMRSCECGQTDRHTLRQRLTEFIICPMLYGTAMDGTDNYFNDLLLHFA